MYGLVVMELVAGDLAGWGLSMSCTVGRDGMAKEPLRVSGSVGEGSAGNGWRDSSSGCGALFDVSFGSRGGKVSIGRFTSVDWGRGSIGKSFTTGGGKLSIGKSFTTGAGR